MVTVRVTTQDGSKPPSPSFKAVPGLYLKAVRTGFSSSSSFSFGTGQVTTQRKSEDFRFVAWADKAGEYEIAASIATKEGQVEALDIPVLKVVADPTQAMPGAVAGQGGQSGGEQQLPANTQAGQPFIAGYLEQDEIWLGESFHYRAETWAPVQGGGRYFYFKIPQLPDLPAATKQSLKLQGKRRERMSNVLYNVEEVANALVTPQRAGTLDVPGLAGTAQLVERAFFDLRPVARAVEVVAEGQRILVKPLPAAGQPPNFRSFNVGKFRVDAKVDRTEVPAGEGLTLTITFSGQGNLALVEPDAWPDLPGSIRRYDPEVSQPQRSFKQGKAWGKRSWSFLLIPDGGGRFTIPPHTLHYFDPDSGQYAVAESKTIEIEVAGKAAVSRAATGAQGKSNAKSAGVRDDQEAPLAPIRGGQTLGRVVSDSTGTPLLTPGRWSWLAGLVPVAFTATWIGGRLWASFGPDDAARALADKHKVALEQLEAAGGAVDSGEGFWGPLGEVLQRAAVDRLGEDARGLTREALAQRLADAELPRDEIDSWKELLDRADAARYGAGSEDATARRAALGKAKAIVAEVNWRPRA
jgi:hypothetical protein